MNISFYATGRKIYTSVNYVTVHIIIGGISRLTQRVMKSLVRFIFVECAKRNFIFSSNIGNTLLDHIVLGMHNCEILSHVFFPLPDFFLIFPVVIQEELYLFVQ